MKNSLKNTASLSIALLLLAGCASTSPSNPSAYDINNWPKLKSAGVKDNATERRIDQIMAQMTLEEKVGQTIQADIAFIKPDDLLKYPLGSILAGGNSSPGGNERATPQEWLKLADDYWRASDARPTKAKIPLLFGIDAVHGHSNLVGAIVFPHNIGLGASRNPALMREIGEITAKEMLVVGVDWTFAPTVATPQDDRWGRTYEGYSEDPSIVESYSASVVEGLQGKNGGKTGIVGPHIMANAKHFLGDGGTKNGIDQGDAQIDEKTLVKIHNGGYPPAIEAGILSVMASFSSWNGSKVTGNKYLLTDVLKDRMGFEGFVVSDWNAQGQIPGCTNSSCPQALNAGIDMYMAPDSWKALYTNTLAQVKSGEIPMSRLDDAVRRILRSKIKAGLFEMGAPASRPMAGKFELLGDKSSREIARRAVRESLVLLKNNNSVLPIKPSANILVAGDGADNIGKQSGGWTLTWQGTGNSNSDFPNGQSIYGGIKEIAEANGGKVTLSQSGDFTAKPDVAIVVIGEEPYAEFQGDRQNLDYQQYGTKDISLIKKLKSQNIPVVTVFLSGRPMFTNPEINASDAFVAAFLPGSEGGGIADVLLANKDNTIRHDFKGKLSFSWPKFANQFLLNPHDLPYDPQFALGFGLNYQNKVQTPMLNEATGIKDVGIVNADNYFSKGRINPPWNIFLSDANGSNKVEGNGESPLGFVQLRVIDTSAQESGRRITFSGQGPANIRIEGDRVDLSRQTTGDMVLRLRYRLDAPINGRVSLGMGRDPFVKQEGDISSLLSRARVGEWAYLNVRLSCFKNIGTDMNQVAMPFFLATSSRLSLSFDEITLKSNDSGDAVCPQ